MTSEAVAATVHVAYPGGAIPTPADGPVERVVEIGSEAVPLDHGYP